MPITIIPGETTTFVLKSISKKLNLNLAYLKKFYRDIAPFKEGNFLADTYNMTTMILTRKILLTF